MGSSSVVLTDAHSGMGGRSTVETAERADTGVKAIGSDQVTGTEGTVGGLDGKKRGAGNGVKNFGAVNRPHGGLPEEADAESEGAIDEELVEQSSTSTDSGSFVEEAMSGGGRVRGFEEADSAKRGVWNRGGVNAEAGKSVDRGGHEAFAAGLVDGGPVRVDDEDTKSAAGRGDCGDQAGRAPAGDEQVEGDRGLKSMASCHELATPLDSIQIDVARCRKNVSQD
jgi:hypothetical protein